MNKDVLQALNDQANFEFYSGYIYLHLSLQMEKENYKGFSKWLLSHYKEEFAHGEDFLAYIIKRDETPTLQSIKFEDIKVSDPLEVAKIILAHEKEVTKRIYKLHDLAKKNDDYATEIFMHSYINEQIEEENLAKEIVDSFTLAGDSTAAKITIDREMKHIG